MKKIAYILIFIIALILFFILIFYITDTKISEIRDAVKIAGLKSLIIIILAMLGQLFFQAISWKILLYGSNYNISILSCFNAITTGWMANFFTPSMYLGGEPLRAYMITKDANIPFRKALGSVIVHKFIEFTTFMIFIIISTILVFLEFKSIIKKEIQIAIIITVISLIILLIFIIIAIFLKKRFFSPLAKIIIKLKIASKFLNKNMDKILEMENFILDSFYKSIFYTFISFLIMLIFDFLIFIRPLLFFIFFDIKLNLGSLALIFLMIQLIQALQFTPGGIGILEGGTVGILSILSIDVAKSIGFTTFCRLGDILIVSIGFIIALCLNAKFPYEKK